jgi:hypothetical protein
MAQAIGTFHHAPHDATSNVKARNDDALILIIINIHPALRGYFTSPDSKSEVKVRQSPLS